MHSRFPQRPITEPLFSLININDLDVWNKKVGSIVKCDGNSNGLQWDSTGMVGCLDIWQMSYA